MNTLSRIGLAALALGPLAAFAQTTTGTTASTTPGTPETGLGGLVSGNLTTLLVAVLAIAAGVLYLRFLRPKIER